MYQMASETPPTKSQQTLSSTQIMIAVILAIGLMLAINFSSRIAENQHLREARERLEREIATLEAEQATLQAELGYVQSDAYVERWAHEEARMVRPGEILVVPIPAGTPVTPMPTPTPEATEEVEPWQLWWALFFDEPPPIE